MSDIVAVSKGDYVVVKRQKGGNFLFKVSGADRDLASGIVEDDCHIQALRNACDVDRKDIIINLGPDPFPGYVFGADTNALFRGRKDHPDIGPVNFFYKPEKQVSTALWEAFSKTYKILKKHRLDFLINQHTICWEVMPFTGEKFAGMYMTGRGEGDPIRIKFRPEIVEPEQYVYVLMHELAHHLHYQHCNNPRLNAAWIKLFNTSIKQVTIEKSVSHQLLERLLEGQDTPSNFKSDLDEEEVAIYRTILRYIRQNYALSVKELDTLFEAGSKDEIKSVWPTRHVSHKDIQPIISQYATKNYRETFAEAVAFYMTGIKLPKNVTVAVEKTISFARTQRS